MTRIARFALCGAALTGVAVYVSAQTNTQVKVGPKDIGGVCNQHARSRSRRVGDRGDNRSADAVHQRSRDGRPGRYLIPDLPAAGYSVFARGYGLVDSPKVTAKPGQHVDLKPTVAPDKKTAAKLYPGIIGTRC
jgi:hypothetical protein